MLYSPGLVHMPSDGTEAGTPSAAKRARLEGDDDDGLDEPFVIATGTGGLDALTAAVAIATPVDERPECRFFAQGRCAYGAECNFRHAEGVAKAQDGVAKAQDVSPVKKPPCSFFAKGRCTKGAACPFSHVVQMLKPSLTATSNVKAAASAAPGAAIAGVALPPCKYYAQGGCFRGNMCKFAHIDELEKAPEDAPALQVFGLGDDEGGAEALETKAPARTGMDILKKYSTSRKAQELGLEVRVRGAKGKGTGKGQASASSVRENRSTAPSIAESAKSVAGDVAPEEESAVNAGHAGTVDGEDGEEGEEGEYGEEEEESEEEDMEGLAFEDSTGVASFDPYM